MTLHTGFGVKGSTQDAIDYRLGLAGTIARSASGVPRYGVFSPGVSGAGRADMKVDVSAFVAYVGRGSAYGGVLLSNDGTLVSPTFDAAPSSNSRIDVLWVRQNDAVDAADGDNMPVFGIAKGDAASTPTAPAVPTGALPLLNVKLPALVGSTNAVGVEITQAAPFTTSAGGVMPVRTAAERDQWLAPNGSLAERLDNGVLYKRIGGAWAAISEEVLATPGITAGSGYVLGSDIQVTKLSERLVTLQFNVSRDGVGVNMAGSEIMGYLPDGLKPEKTVWWGGAMDGAAWAVCSGKILTNGQIIFRSSNIPSNQAGFTATYVRA